MITKKIVSNLFWFVIIRIKLQVKYNISRDNILQGTISSATHSNPTKFRNGVKSDTFYGHENDAIFTEMFIKVKFTFARTIL